MSKQKVKKPHGIRHSIALSGAAPPQVNEADKAATLSAAAELARQVEAEGMVLVQNRNDTLPLSASIKQVNVFGWASTAWLGGGSASGPTTASPIILY